MSVQGFFRGVALIALLSVGLGMATPAYADNGQHDKPRTAQGGGTGPNPQLNAGVLGVINDILLDVSQQPENVQKAIVDNIKEGIRLRDNIPEGDKQGYLDYIDSQFSKTKIGASTDKSSPDTTPVPNQSVASGEVRIAFGEVVIDGKVVLSKDIQPSGENLAKVTQLLKGYINVNYKQPTLEGQINRLNLPAAAKADLLNYLDAKQTRTR